jgi:hypothetical protein
LADAGATTGIDLTIMELQHRTDPIGNQPDLNRIRGSFFSWAIGEGRRSRPSSVANPKIESDFGRILASMIPAQNPLVSLRLLRVALALLAGAPSKPHCYPTPGDWCIVIGQGNDRSD